ncbi:uncharacterized protein TNCV_4758191 [Trichonephila clavipes]|nr:uncharacterized protein TNCV_4758191 [Trichonephila clavipes]
MEHFTNIELADMHLIYGLEEGKIRSAEIFYRERYQQRDAPDCRMFGNLYHNLCKHRSLRGNRDNEGENLEAQLYSSQQSRGQEPTDFIYDLLKVHKKLGLKMSEESLVGHVFVRLEPQVEDYVEVRNPKTTAQLLEIMAKFKEGNAGFE